MRETQASYLVDQVDLESDEIRDFVRVPRDGNDGDQVDERFAVLPVVDDAGLTFLAGQDVRLHVVSGVAVRVLPSRTEGDVTVWCLKESTVSTDDLVSFIPG